MQQGAPAHMMLAEDATGFRERALINSYKLEHTCYGAIRGTLHDSYSLREFESSLCKMHRMPDQNVAFKLSGYYSWTTSACIKMDTSLKKKVDFARIAVGRTDNRFYRKFGKDRFLQVRILGYSGETEDHQKLAQSPLSIFGENFSFLGGKSFKNRGTDMDSEDANKGKILFIAWFFATEIRPDPEYSEYNVSLRRDLGEFGNKFIHIEGLRYWLGDFTHTKPLKLNARLALGFSDSMSSTFLLRNENILVEDDVMDRGTLMTDGCGYIAV